jgi:2'-5' RNA ligase
LAVLAERVEAAARSIGLSAEERRFRGHVTLARVEAKHPPADRSLPFEDRWLARSFRLMRSDLGRAGATHTVLEEFLFGG